MLAALAASAATLLLTSASAHAGWSPTAPARDYHCGAVVNAPHAPPVAFQSCVIVHDSPSGAYVQGAVKVTNTNDNPRRVVRPTAYTRLWLEGKAYRNGNCGPTAIAGGQTMFCYGQTALILGHGRDVSATGYVWFGAGAHDGITSSHWKISQVTPLQQARARIVAILRAEAANRLHNREVGGADCNFYTAALRVKGNRLCPTGYSSEPWCADFGRWVWGAARVATAGLNARASSFQAYGERMRTWHGGRSLSAIQPGDAVVLRRTGGGHVAFVVAVNRDGSVSAISGNYGDRVASSVYRPGRADVLGFTSPAAS